MAIHTFNGLALCAGVGGLELGLSLAVPEYRCVAHIEREAYAAAILVKRMEEGWLDKAPVWDDIGTFDGRPWRGKVDIISSGFPCQPFSSAGRRRGTEDERWLWPDIARVVRDVRPRYVFLENSPRIVDGGQAEVLRDLAVCGYNAEWDVFSAFSEGAPHQRTRLFTLAHANSGGQPKNEPDLYSGQQDADRGDNCSGEREDSDSDSQGCQKSQGRSEDAKRPGLGTADRRSWWLSEPDVPRVGDGTPPRLDRIRACGNAVLPPVAARAFTELRERLGD